MTPLASAHSRALGRRRVMARASARARPRALPLALAATLALSLGSQQLLAQGGPPPPQPLQPPPSPLGNPPTAAKILLGEALFWDEQLSSTRSMACGSCHINSAGGSDPRTVLGDAGSTHPGADGSFGNADDVSGSPGIPLCLADGSYLPSASFDLGPQVTGRKAPPSINAAYFEELFWDGRAGAAFFDPDTEQLLVPAGGALENQALGPPLSSAEMGHLGRELSHVAQRIEASDPLALAAALPADLAAWIAGRSYPDLFALAFGSSEVSAARMGLAIAAYERTLFSDQTPWDELAGGNPGALTPQEAQGRAVFVGSGCATCHGGPLFSDGDFHYIGVRPADEDTGRFAVTGNPGDRGAMKTPSLRNVELRAPYMHNGRFATLDEVIDFYDRGGDFNAPNKAPQIQPLGLSPQQKLQLRAFLTRPLTDPRVVAESGPFERPLLAAELGRLPLVYGAPGPGSGGAAPRAVAAEPPHHASPDLTLALDHGLGGAPTWLVFDLVPGQGAPVQGAPSWLGLSGATVIFDVGTLAGNGAGAGWTSVVFDVASAGTSLVGLDLFAQWFVADPDGPAGLASSSGVQLSVF